MRLCALHSRQLAFSFFFFSDLAEVHASHHTSPTHLTSRIDFLAFVQTAERLTPRVGNFRLLGNNSCFATMTELGQQQINPMQIRK